MLIVDDHPTFRRFARRVLEEAGFTVVGEAHDATGAIEAARRLQPAVVLLDIVLPDRSGLDVAEALARSPGAPTIILTSSRSAHDFGLALGEAPVQGFIPKAGLTGASFAAAVKPT